MPSKKVRSMTKKEFMAISIAMISADSKLQGLWLPEFAAKVVRAHVVGSGVRNDKQLKEVLGKVLHTLRANTNREVTRKTLVATGLLVEAESVSQEPVYSVKGIVAHDYTKEGCVATVRWEDTCEPMRALPRNIVRKYFRKCIGRGSAFERKYVLAEAEEK
ncbi:hypothetical protein F441_06910 [Phytophthora nicotianae CJ01A1]|uniref:Uncharacterized protein n=4 Tax=Phytophthora nicotianae TaxID=4792 RepID=V9FFI2_PHYNI|nr:hypothetical protein F443_06904 [Phytophthora nicotianae P1569]ETK89062.1 hypothetical protein L915_06785 [Phytophthora nicotianae]ETO77909.1 hypothetical protein F444_06974 [Phytophthora nicotianae P1976]ETP18950.1 hypothetical protein F441_06910 [Phytophthora nicotianae CJ01A1]ETL42479.1 hypothetical protein L916_06719 [Phytophthora nicotianae]